MNKGGFTRIEVLFVLLVLVALAFYAYISFGSIAKKSRDAERLKELNSFARGLDLYYDLNNMYPCGDTLEENNDNNNLGGTFDISLKDCKSNIRDTRGFLNGYGLLKCNGDLVDYSSLPMACQSNPAGLYSAGILGSNRLHDPKYSEDGPPNYVYSYHVSPDRQNYILAAYLEELKNAMQSDGGTCPFYYELGNAHGTIKPWDDIACGCDGTKSYDICM